MSGTWVPGLDFIATATLADPGLKAKVQQWRIQAGADGAIVTNVVINEALDETGVNADHLLTPYELTKVADTIAADGALYRKFMLAHGDDEGDLETGFHFVQNDGATLLFQGRNFADVVADAIGHIGFSYANGRFVDEDGNVNQKITDIAGWMNYFMNGTTMVWGGNGSDSLGSGKYSPIFKGAANEIFKAYGGNDNVWADDGNDTVYCGYGTDSAGGGNGNDKLWGEQGADNLYGENGNDVLHGGSANDSESGGSGNDLLFGDDGGDRLWGDDGADQIHGGEGWDEMGGGAGDDQLFGDAGNDKLYGDSGNDILHGSWGADSLGGGDGADTLYGEWGDDSLNGGIGNDMMLGGDGNDDLWGDIGNDNMSGGAGADSMGGGAGNDIVNGDDGDDDISGQEGDDWLNGNAGNDRISGDVGSDKINGGTGNDTIYGGDGRDLISGGDGNDTIDAGEGYDLVVGGAGADKITLWDNSAAVDVVRFAAGDSGIIPGTMDVIEGFQVGEDKIDLRAIPNMHYTAGLAHLGAGVASVFFSGGNLLVDSDGDGVTDMAIQLSGVASVSANDFLLV